MSAEREQPLRKRRERERERFIQDKRTTREARLQRKHTRQGERLAAETDHNREER